MSMLRQKLASLPSHELWLQMPSPPPPLLLYQCSRSAPTFLPVLNGKYLYLIMCLICRFIVTVNSSSQYSSRMGQNTGTSNMGNSVIAIPIQMDFIDDHLHTHTITQGRVGARCRSMGVGRFCCQHPSGASTTELLGLCRSSALCAAHQNLNSGNRLTKGLNSWSDFVGRPGASCSSSGSTCGVMKPSSRLRLYMPSP